MGPGNLRRSVQDDFLQVLGDRSLRGDRLMEAISLLGPQVAAEPFRAAVGCVFTLDCAETEARDTLAAVEHHRTDLETLLGRDPGFVVAALDLLHEMGGTLRDPVFREHVSPGMEPSSCEEDRALERFDEALRLEIRRAVRFGGPLALIRLSPDAAHGLTAGPRENGFALLRDAVREVDVVAPAPAGGFLVLLPSTGGKEALQVAERLRRYLETGSDLAFSAGVASADRGIEAQDLVRRAGKALREARRTGGGVALYRPDRRAHGRVPVGGEVSGKLRCAGIESEVHVEDLSLSGALLALPGRIAADSEVILALYGSGSRPQAVLIPSRVVRVADRPTPGQLPWRAAVDFRPEARLRVAALLAQLDDPGTGKVP